MIRDKYNIIVQGAKEDPNYQDGGDSAFSTGIMAGSGFPLDAILMHDFIINNQVVRHPHQDANTGTAPHNNPKATSRDQIKAFFFGLPFLKYLSESDKSIYKSWEPVQAACLYYANRWFVNADILMPADRLYLFKCAGEEAPWWIKALGYPNQALSLIWDCFIAHKIDPTVETNQSICTNIVFGKSWITFMNKHHPNLKGSVEYYFSGWRDKKEMGIALIKKIEASL